MGAWGLRVSEEYREEKRKNGCYMTEYKKMAGGGRILKKIAWTHFMVLEICSQMSYFEIERLDASLRRSHLGHCFLQLLVSRKDQFNSTFPFMQVGQFP